jgi:hypothetical protein
MSQLTPCPECQRHVRKSETSCPFCQTALSLSHLPDHALPRKRLGRAATFAFGATVAGATALGACDDSATVAPPYGLPGGSSFAGIAGAPPSGSSSGGTTNGDAGAGTAIYGAPAAGAGGEEPGGDGGNGGTSGNGGAAGEGGVTDDGGFGGGLIYGAPPSGAGGV